MSLNFTTIGSEIFELLELYNNFRLAVYVCLYKCSLAHKYVYS